MGFLERPRWRQRESLPQHQNPKDEEATILRELDRIAGGEISPADASRLAEALAPAVEQEHAKSPWDPTVDLRTYVTKNAAITRAGRVRGRHFTEWPDHLRQLKRDGRSEEALALLLECIIAAELSRDGREPAPWYTEQAAIILRKRGDHTAEVAVLERWIAACPPARFDPAGKIPTRLVKARELREH